MSALKKAATGDWTGDGRTDLELETLDSLTNERIGAVVDENIDRKTSSSRFGDR